MKICLITDSYPPNVGGAEIAVQKIAEGVNEKGNDLFVITSEMRDNFPFNSTLKNNSIIRIKIPGRLPRFWFLLFSFFVILKRGRGAEILHGTSYGGILQTFLASKILRKPAIVTVHEFMGKRWNKFAHNIFTAYFFRTAEKIYSRLSFDQFIAVSEYTKKCLIEAGVDEDKISVIHNGSGDLNPATLRAKSAVRKELGIEDDKFVFAMYGRTGLTKGFEYAVDAIEEVLKKIPDSFFLLILSPGDKKIYRRILSKIKEINSDRILTFPSMERIQVLNYVNSSDAVIIPSLSEGFGFTTLEACIMNKIVIASNVGSIPEVIHGNYILVEPEATEKLTGACIKAFEGKYELSEKKEFDWNNSINKYIKVYQDVLNFSVK